MTLSPRQIRIFEMVGSGMSYKEIAAELGIAPGTLNSLMNRAKRKAGVASTVQLAVFVALGKFRKE